MQATKSNLPPMSRIPTSRITDDRFTLSHMKVHEACCARANAKLDNILWPTVATIAVDTGLHERTVQNVRQDLTDWGYMQRLGMTPWGSAIYQVRIGETFIDSSVTQQILASKTINPLSLPPSLGECAPSAVDHLEDGDDLEELEIE